MIRRSLVFFVFVFLCLFFFLLMFLAKCFLWELQRGSFSQPEVDLKLKKRGKKELVLFDGTLKSFSRNVCSFYVIHLRASIDTDVSVIETVCHITGLLPVYSPDAKFPLGALAACDSYTVASGVKPWPPP